MYNIFSFIYSIILVGVSFALNNNLAVCAILTGRVFNKQTNPSLLQAGLCYVSL